jgi:hypothetical protein
MHEGLMQQLRAAWRAEQRSENRLLRRKPRQYQYAEMSDLRTPRSCHECLVPAVRERRVIGKYGGVDRSSTVFCCAECQ